MARRVVQKGGSRKFPLRPPLHLAGHEEEDPRGGASQGLGRAEVEQKNKTNMMSRCEIECHFTLKPKPTHPRVGGGEGEGEGGGGGGWRWGWGWGIGGLTPAFRMYE